MTSITVWFICGGSMVSAWAVLPALWLEAGPYFFNDGIKHKMTLTPVPEIEAIYPIISMCAWIAFTRTLRQRRTAQLKADAGAER